MRCVYYSRELDPIALLDLPDAVEPWFEHGQLVRQGRPERVILHAPNEDVPETLTISVVTLEAQLLRRGPHRCGQLFTVYPTELEFAEYPRLLEQALLYLRRDYPALTDWFARQELQARRQLEERRHRAALGPLWGGGR